MITNKDLQRLANSHEPHSITIMIPTERGGKEVIEGQPQLRLKNMIKEVKRELGNYDLSSDQIDGYLNDITDLLDDADLWRHLSDSLVIFKNDALFEYFTVPLEIKEQYMIADHFYLKSLIPLVTVNEKYYVLSLSLQQVKLFECSRYSIQEIDIHDLVPDRLEDTVGYDQEQKNLQVRGKQTGRGTPMYHGHGEGIDDKKVETSEFLRDVNNGIMQVLNLESAPLLLACTDSIAPVYREVNDYKNLYDQIIPGNPEHFEPGMLHEHSWQVISDYFGKKLDEKKEQYMNSISRSRASVGVEDITSAALNGRVDTLFIKKGEKIWGRYFPDLDRVVVHDDNKTGDAELLDLCAVNTYLNKGAVILLDEDEMPEDGTVINAILRY